MIKGIFALIVTIVATVSVVFFIASSSALNTPDIKDRRDAFVTAFWSLLTFGLCAFAFTLLTGCQAAKTIIDTCHDGLCR
jgi:hypothetical protein